MMRIRMITIVAAAALLLGGCHQRPTISKSEPGAKEARHRVDADRINAPGSVEPWLGEVKLASVEPGRIEEVLAHDGEHVRVGDLLARLEDSQQRHAVWIAEADVRQATAALGGVTSTVEEVRAAEAELIAAQTRAEQQARDLQRATLLGARGTSTPVDVEQAAAAARENEAARQAAEARLSAVKRGARSSERLLLRARRDAAVASLANARAALARREVRSSIDGVVLWSRYHAGEFYSQAQGPLLVLGDLRRLQVRLEVDEADSGRVQVGARCQLRDDAGEALGEGSVARIAYEYGSRSLSTERPSARTDARVREVFVEVDAPGSFTPGQRVWGDISTSTLRADR